MKFDPLTKFEGVPGQVEGIVVGHLNEEVGNFNYSILIKTPFWSVLQKVLP